MLCYNGGEHKKYRSSHQNKMDTHTKTIAAADVGENEDLVPNLLQKFETVSVLVWPIV